MKIITVSDIHSDIRMVEKMEPELSAADLVLLSGDLTNFGGKEEAMKVIEAFRQYNPNILAVAGNCDHRGVEDYLEEEGISLHRKCKVIDDIAIAGAGGSLLTPFFTPNEISDHAMEENLLEAAMEIPAGLPLVLLVHHPPFQTRVDLVPDSGNLGSTTLRNFIQEKQPLVCFSGHIHEAIAIDAIGTTKLANPGPLRNGHYLYCEIEGTLKTLEIRKIL